MGLADREAIMSFIAADNVTAAVELDLEFEAKAEIARQRPTLYKAGRVKGARELVVRPNDVMVYQVLAHAVEILRVLHVAQQWPPQKMHGVIQVGPGATLRHAKKTADAGSQDCLVQQGGKESAHR